MHHTHRRGRILEVGLFAVASLLLYALGLREIIFLIPIQVAGARRGWGSLIATAAVSLVLFAGYGLYMYLSEASRDAVTMMGILIQTVPTALLVLGLVVVNLPAFERFRVLFRLLAATLAVGAVAAPCLLLIPRLPSFTPAITQIFTNLSDQLRALTSTVGTTSPFEEFLKPQVLMSLLVEYFLRLFLLYYFIILSVGYWAGTLIGKRTVSTTLEGAPEKAPITRLSAFRLEGWFLWPLIILGAAILLDIVVKFSAVGFSPLSYAVWNLGELVFFLYGLQGMAILKFLFEKYRLPRILWVLAVVLVVILLASPRAGIIIFIGMPAFGVSETWIRYRVPAEPVSDDD